jgi:hypothetical protein
MKVTKQQFLDWYDNDLGMMFMESGERFIRDWIHCADGYMFSVQASEFHQCHPRKSGGPWSHFEVGYPSEEPTYFEGKVQGFVPLDNVISEINLHGGIDFEAYEEVNEV